MKNLKDLGLLGHSIGIRQLFEIQYYTFALLIVCAMIWTHSVADFTFPVPWPDEAVFVRQAISFEQQYSLFVPQLNPSRDVMWMPPGYAIVLGMLFKIAGSGLAVARSVSLVTMVAVFLLLARLLHDWPARYFVLALCGLFFLNRHFIILGNVARMEAFLILGIIISLTLFYHDKPFRALTVLLILPLLHPNALYFVCSGLLVIIIQVRLLKQTVRIEARDKVFLVTVFVLFAGYLLYAALHWSDFLHDITYQFARKGRRNIAAPFLELGSIVFTCTAVCTVLVAMAKKHSQIIALGMFSLSFWMVNKIGQEMWYEVFDDIALLLLAFTIIRLLTPSGKSVVSAALALAAIAGGFRLGLFENPVGYPYNLKWYSMQISADVNYITRQDVERIGRLLTERGSEQGLLQTKFFPDADALFFQNFENKSMRSIHAAPEAYFFPERGHDLYLVHFSRYLPKGWDGSSFPWVLESSKIDTSDNSYLLFQRDSTERWYYRFENDGRAPAPSTQSEPEKKGVTLPPFK